MKNGAGRVQLGCRFLVVGLCRLAECFGRSLVWLLLLSRMFDLYDRLISWFLYRLGGGRAFKSILLGPLSVVVVSTLGSMSRESKPP
ncbi:hypothetical protein Hdeb2414_s0016g00490881 [Helianthus debilis subsp. tardiflorus]